MATAKQQQFCMKVYRAARAQYEADPGGTVSPRFTTAQAMLESAWGARAIGNNIFGITAGTSWKGPVRMAQTTEVFATPTKRFQSPERVLKVAAVGKGRWRYTVVRRFRDYASLGEALADHNALFRRPMYADAWPYRLQAKEFAHRISDAMGARYATDPDYYRTMCRMLQSVDAVVAKNK